MKQPNLFYKNLHFGRSNLIAAACRKADAIGTDTHFHHFLKNGTGMILSIFLAQLAAANRRYGHNIKPNRRFCRLGLANSLTQSIMVVYVAFVKFRRKQRFPEATADETGA